MKTSSKGIDLMHRFEGYRNRPYRCSAAVWTIGWGHALYADQLALPNARVGDYTGPIRGDYQLKPEDNRVWTKEELVEIFKADLVRFERGVLRLVPGSTGRQGSFDALVSFAFNVGLGNLQRSTIRMRANRSEWDAAGDAFLMWNKAGGKVLPGLDRRRRDERAMFLSS